MLNAAVRLALVYCAETTRRKPAEALKGFTRNVRPPWRTKLNQLAVPGSPKPNQTTPKAKRSSVRASAG